MPLITATVSTPHLKVLPRAEIAAEIGRLTATILGKDPNVTAVIVERVDPATWFVAGRSLTDAWLASFWIDVHVTDGTNPARKRRLSSPPRSPRWKSCSGRCTRKAMSTSMRCAAMLTAMAA